MYHNTSPRCICVINNAEGQQFLQLQAFKCRVAIPNIHYQLKALLKPQEHISTIRGRLYTQFPFRLTYCSRGHSKCCGACTQLCSTRCLYDCMVRLYQVLDEDPQHVKPITKIVYMLVTDPSATPEQYALMVAQLVNGWFHADDRHELRLQGIMENPHKMNYAPRPVYLPGTFIKATDEDTGRIEHMEWPASGMCPYCLPMTTRNKGRGPTK